MKRKRNQGTGEITKYKERLNIDGSRQVQGLHYDNSHSPVASWESIRLLLAIAIKNSWHIHQLDFIQAFHQAPVEHDIYMAIPRGYKMGDDDQQKYALQIKKNIYSQKQSGLVWNQYLISHLIKIGFTQCKNDQCILTKGTSVYIVYVDDSILIGKNQQEIKSCIEIIKQSGLDPNYL